MILIQPVTTLSTDSESNRSPRWAAVVLGAVGAVLLAFLSFPPAGFGLLAWFALIPLLYVLGTARRPWEGGLIGLIYGAAFYGLFFYYVARYGVLPLVAIMLFHGLFFAAFGWLMVYVRAVRCLLLRAAAMAAAWVLIEYVRGHIGLLSLTLADLAYTQHQLLSVLQIASVLGAGAVTFVVVFANGILASVLLQPKLYPRDPRTGGPPPSLAKAVIGGFALIFVVILVGASAIQIAAYVRPAVKEIAAGKSVHVAVMQGNVEIHHPTTEEDANQCRLVYTFMTGEIPAKIGADLVVWPETAFPVVLNNRPFYLEEVQDSAREVEAYLLMGALEQGGSGELYNTAYLFSPEGELVGTYRKHRLVIFGEYVPNLGPLNALVKRYPVRPFNIVPGGERQLLTVNAVPFGTLICWEATMAAPSRELCRKGAQFLTFITSDSWAAGSAELWQNAATAPVRAVESRRYVVRAATMGPSAILNPYGRPLAGIPAGADAPAHHKIYPLAGLSTYHRIGDLPLLIICLLVWVVAMFRRETEPAAPESR